MSEDLASTLVMGLGLYCLVGLVVAGIYALGGAGKIDPAAKGNGMPWRVRLLIIPGLMGLWPLMLAKLFVQSRPPIQ